MRLWSLHPKYLDAKGLVALWRETLLAKHVLSGLTKGYTNHPQLNRFKKNPDPVGSINFYLRTIYDEACLRQYRFDGSKFNSSSQPLPFTVTKGQMDYEVAHLLNKLKERDKEKFKELKKVKNFDPHPLFRIVKGNVEDWEIIQ